MKGIYTMLSENDKQLLSRLQAEYPEAYDFYIRREKEHQKLLKTGCHDLRNIVTLISGSYQLLGLTNPQLSSIPRFARMGEDIKLLTNAFNDIALYRYAAVISPSTVSLSSIEAGLREFIHEKYAAAEDRLILVCDNPDSCISTDALRLSTAICCLISNAVEASDFGSPAASVTITLETSSDSHFHAEVINCGTCPSPDMSRTMFEPFQSDKTDHLGLGLAIASETADALGGNIIWNHFDGITSFILNVNC